MAVEIPAQGGGGHAHVWVIQARSELCISIEGEFECIAAEFEASMVNVIL